MKKDLDNNLKDKKTKTEKKNNWIYIVLVMTFVLSILFSFISNEAITNLDIVPSLIILVVVVFVGIMFDLIGIAVTVGNEEDFHAQASKKIKAGEKIEEVALKRVNEFYGVVEPEGVYYYMKYYYDIPQEVNDYYEEE